MNLPKISKRLEHYSMYDVDDISCIYRIVNIRSEKSYIGNTKNLRTRLAKHIYTLKNAKHYNSGLQTDFDAGDVFRIEVLTALKKSDNRKKRNALEAYFVMLYNMLDEGYNMVYTYRDAAHTIESIKENAEYISLCLRKTEIDWNKV